MNITKFLIDRHGMRFEEIAAAVGCSFQSTRDWYKGKVKPLEIYQAKLQEILNSKQPPTQSTPKVG